MEAHEIEIDIYANPKARREGQIHIGKALVTTSAKGVASFTIAAPTGSRAGVFLTATATDQTGNSALFGTTSEFSKPYLVQ